MGSAKICICEYVQNLNPEENIDEIDSCNSCDLDECWLVQNIDTKNVFKNIEVRDIEDVQFPCIVFQDDRGIITYISIADTKENTKYGIKPTMW